jgi:hypothetical protein
VPAGDARIVGSVTRSICRTSIGTLSMPVNGGFASQG